MPTYLGVWSLGLFSPIFFSTSSNKKKKKNKKKKTYDTKCHVFMAQFYLEKSSVIQLSYEDLLI